MCKKCSGFTLVEAVFALALLLVVTTALLPLFTQIAIERQNIALKAKAQQLLSVALHEEDMKPEATVADGRTTFVLRSYYEENDMWKVCVRWNDYAGRSVERCGYGKR
jgi:competence protein ComGE